MLRKLLALAALSCAFVGGAATAATTQADIKEPGWSFSGPLGMYDQAQLQRGFKVYTEVCAQCHSLNLISFGDLGGPGGPFYNPKYPNSNDNPVVKALRSNLTRRDQEDLGVRLALGDVLERRNRGEPAIEPTLPDRQLPVGPHSARADRELHVGDFFFARDIRNAEVSRLLGIEFLV